MNKVICKACGSTSLEPKGDFLACRYCDTMYTLPTKEKQNTPSNMANKVVLQEVGEPSFVKASFSLSQVEEILKSAMISQEDIPEDFLIHTKVNESNLVYLPTFLFDVEYNIKWRGEIGYTQYHSSTDGDGNTSSYTTTDWRSENGLVEDTQEIYGVGNRELRSKAILLEKTPKMTTHSIKDFPDDALTLPDFDILPQDEWVNALETLSSSFHQRVEEQLPGDDSRNIHIDGVVQKVVVKRLYIPHVFGDYTYNGTSYEFQIDGRFPDMVLYHQRPVCNARRETLESFVKVRKTFGRAFWAYLIAGSILLFVAMGFEMHNLMGSGFVSVFLTTLPILVMWIIFGIIMGSKRSSFTSSREKFQKTIKDEKAKPNYSPRELVRKHEDWMDNLGKVKRQNKRLKTLARVLCIVAFIVTFMTVIGYEQYFNAFARGHRTVTSFTESFGDSLGDELGNEIDSVVISAPDNSHAIALRIHITFSPTVESEQYQHVVGSVNNILTEKMDYYGISTGSIIGEVTIIEVRHTFLDSDGKPVREFLIPNSDDRDDFTSGVMRRTRTGARRTYLAIDEIGDYITGAE
jgi:hypothetical protein